MSNTHTGTATPSFGLGRGTGIQRSQSWQLPSSLLLLLPEERQEGRSQQQNSTEGAGLSSRASYSRSLLLGSGASHPLCGTGEASGTNAMTTGAAGYGLLPAQGGIVGRTEHDDRVDFVHHSSPVGPAVSVYPKGCKELTTATNTTRISTNRYYEQVDPRTPPPRGRSGWQLSSHFPDAAQSSDEASFSLPSPPLHDPAPPTPPTTTSSPRSIMVEIFPGVHAKLRGADETRECVRTNFFVPCVCPSCDMDMFCIQDALYVLCPGCRVVSPLDMLVGGQDSLLEISSNHSRDVFFDGGMASCNHHHSNRGNSSGGLGLGFSREDLQAIQRESYLMNDSHGNIMRVPP